MYNLEKLVVVNMNVSFERVAISVFADWYNAAVMEKVNFFDENTRRWWMPETGGSNVPALNDLLKPYGVAFSDRVFEGDFALGEHDMYYASGTSIAKFPADGGGKLIYRSLTDQAAEIVGGKKGARVSDVPVLGMRQVRWILFKI